MGGVELASYQYRRPGDDHDTIASMHVLWKDQSHGILCDAETGERFGEVYFRPTTETAKRPATHEE